MSLFFVLNSVTVYGLENCSLFSTFAEAEYITSDANPQENKVDEAEVFFKKLRELAYSGHTNEAIELAEEYLQKKDSKLVRIFLGRMLAWQGKYQAAREQLLYVLAKNPLDYDANDALADVDLWSGNYDKALDRIKIMKKYYPADKNFLDKEQKIREKMLAKEKLEMNTDSTATGKKAKVILSSSSQCWLWNNVLDDVGEKNYCDKKTMLPRKKPVKTANKKENFACFAWGNLQLENKNEISLPSQLPRDSASESPTYEELKEIAHDEDHKKAIAILTKQLQNKDDTDVRILLGYVLLWDSQYDRARQEFQTVLQKQPGNSDAIIGLASLEVWSGDKKQALAIVDSALKNDARNVDLLLKWKEIQEKMSPDDSKTTYDQIRDLVRNGQRQKAKELAEQELKKAENVDIRTLLGYINSWDGDYPEARKNFQKVLSDKPSYTDASRGLVNVEIWSNNYSAALQVIKEALKFKPQDEELLKERDKLTQAILQSVNYPGLTDLYGTPNLVGPHGKRNAFFLDQQESYISDLNQTWNLTTLSYARYTGMGSIILTYNYSRWYNTPASQYVVEAYPRLFKRVYAYVGYAYAKASYLPNTYIGYEPYLTLPAGFEISAGERILWYGNPPIHVYTGSIAKYLGNFWFAFRPYFTGAGSKSYYGTVRRYFSSPDSYVTFIVGGGSGPSTLDLLNPNNLTSDHSISYRFDGETPLMENLILTWLINWSLDHFPNGNRRQQTDFDIGLIYRF